MGVCIASVLRGIHGGIEKACDILMPTLVFFLFLLMIRSLTREGAMEGVAFYLSPDFSKINSNTILIALGQAFFSLSLGIAFCNPFLPTRPTTSPKNNIFIFVSTNFF